MRFTIADLTSGDTSRIEQCAALLVEGFREHWPGAWEDMDSALEEVREALQPERICRVALSEAGEVLGWVGGQDMGYDGRVWELHPMVVHAEHRKHGIGRALVADLEAQARERGGLTLMLGTDDEDDMTSLSGADLYADLWQHIRDIQNDKGHPYEFYQKCGFVITGVVPDANGRGKPDILMAKRL